MNELLEQARHRDARLCVCVGGWGGGLYLGGGG